jgi:hypothetical protein
MTRTIILFYIMVLITNINFFKKTEFKDTINTNIDYFTREAFSYFTEKVISPSVEERSKHE